MCIRSHERHHQSDKLFLGPPQSFFFHAPPSPPPPLNARHTLHAYTPEPQILDEVVKLRQVLRTAGKNQTASGSRGAGFLGYTEALMSIRCLFMAAFWTFDNLNYLTLTDTVNFGVARATKGFSRSWSVASALYILLGIDSLRKVRFCCDFSRPLSFLSRVRSMSARIVTHPV